MIDDSFHSPNQIPTICESDLDKQIADATDLTRELE